MKLGLEGRSFLVLVSSQGLGKGIAGELAAQGARVMISSRNEARAAKDDSRTALDNGCQKCTITFAT